MIFPYLCESPHQFITIRTTGTELTFEIIENKREKKSFLTPVRRSIRNKANNGTSCTQSSASLLHLNQLLIASKLEQTDFNYQPNLALKQEEAEEEIDSEVDVSTEEEEGSNDKEDFVDMDTAIEKKDEETTKENLALGSSFVTQTLIRKDGSRTCTPVRRSSRLSSSKVQTPVLFG